MKTIREREYRSPRTVPFRRIAVGNKFFGAKKAEDRGQTFEKIDQQICPIVSDNRVVNAKVAGGREYKFFPPHIHVLPM